VHRHVPQPIGLQPLVNFTWSVMIGQAGLSPPAWLVEEEEVTAGSTLGVAWHALADAWRLRGAGNASFATGDLAAAQCAYLDAKVLAAKAENLGRLEDLAATDPWADERLRSGICSFRVPLESNLSLVCLRLGDARGSIVHADACLVLEPKNLKALYRRALAAIELGDVEMARHGFSTVLEVDPLNREARDGLRRCSDCLLAGASETEHDVSAPSTREEGQDDPKLEKLTADCHDEEKKGPPTELLEQLWEQVCTGGISQELRMDIVNWLHSLLDDRESCMSDCASIGRGSAGLVAATLLAFVGVDASSLRHTVQARGTVDASLHLLCLAGPGTEEEILAVALLELLNPGDSSTRGLLAARGRLGWSPLHIAAGHGSALVVEALLDAGADVDLADADERTALHHGAIAGHICVASLLLDAGCAVDVQDRHRRSPLYYAGVRDHRNLVALLVDRGQADQSVLFHALKEKFGTHNFMLHDWPEYNGRWMTSKEGRVEDAPLRPCGVLPLSPCDVQRGAF